MPEALKGSPIEPSQNSIGTPFIELQSVDSTNNYARDQLMTAGLPERQGLSLHGKVYFAHEQLQGKGQRGRVWTSEPGANIAMSVLVDPHPFLPSQQFQLIACIAVSLHEFFVKYAGDETRIKWPNDLYWQDRKAGGILIESIVRSGVSATGQTQNEWNWAIIGIGININQSSFPVDLPNPVSLKQITGKEWDPVALARELCVVMDNNYVQLTRGGFDEILSRYNSSLYKKNELVKLKKDTRVFQTCIRKVTPSGRLVTQHTIEEDFDFGEIEWLM